MPGLIDSTQGLCYAAGQGLDFESGLGSAGLTNPPNGAFAIPAVVTFSGAGNLTATGTLRLQASARFAGQGSLRQ